LFHHDPEHDDATIRSIESIARKRAADARSPLHVFAAAEGMQLDIEGRGSASAIIDVSALEHRSVAGSRVLIVADRERDVETIQQALSDDDLVLNQVRDGAAALDRILKTTPDLIIMSATLKDGQALDFVEPLRQKIGRFDLPVIVLTEQTGSD